MKLALALALLLAAAPFLAAQSDTPPPPAEKWEYCVVTGGGSVPEGAQVRLNANIRYFTTNGLRVDTVEIVANNRRDSSWQILEVTAKALAQLGAEGWELVSVLPSALDQYRDNLGFHTHYLKRRVR